jgi:short-subunit dehydrogenase
MRERKSGCIINIASRAGTVTTPFAVAYSAGKAALIRATSVLQAELEVDGLGDQIQIYALHPGAVRTQMVRKYQFLATLFNNRHATNIFSSNSPGCCQEIP